MSATLFKKKTEDKKSKPLSTKSDLALVNSASGEAEFDSEPRKSVLPQGEDSESYRFVLSPHVTEKATNGNVLNKYTFKVSKDSNKIELKKAIEKLYKVKVSAVNIQSMPSKSRQVGRYMGTKSGFKKAVITLRAGQKIEVV